MVIAWNEGKSCGALVVEYELQFLFVKFYVLCVVGHKLLEYVLIYFVGIAILVSKLLSVFSLFVSSYMMTINFIKLRA